MITPGNRLLLPFLAVLMPCLFLADLTLGSIHIPLPAVLKVLTGTGDTQTWRDILLDIRLPKALTALLAGASLATGGILTQSLFRNPLTGPDSIGLTSGAGLGVALAVLAGAGSGMGITLAIAASAGATASFLIMVMVGSRVSGSTLLVAGLMFGAFTSAVVSALQFFSTSQDLQRYTLWTLGSIGGTGMEEVKLLALACLTGLIMAMGSVKGLNGFALGEAYAQSIGINTKRLKILVLIVTSLLTGAVTAFCGPVTFIGIAAPHFIRRVAGTSDHRVLLPASALSGACLLLACDMLTLLPGGDEVLPLNAVTALFGAPVVIWILLRSKTYFFA